MQVKSIAEWEHSAILSKNAILSTFIKLPIVFKIFVLTIFEWPFYTGFTVVYSDAALVIFSQITYKITKILLRIFNRNISILTHLTK